MAEPFIPSTTATLSTAELEAIAQGVELEDFDDIAADQGWTWDDDNKVWRDRSGAEVSETRVDAALFDYAESSRATVDEVTNQLLDGELSLADWQRAVADAIAILAGSAYLFGLGRFSEDGLPTIRERLSVQFDYLSGFGSAIAVGGLSENAIIYRAQLYVLDGQHAFDQGLGDAHPADEYPFESNELGTGEASCRECPGLSGLGRVARGTLPMIGARDCLMRCKCKIRYHRTQDGTDSLSRGFGWVGLKPQLRTKYALLSQPMRSHFYH